MIEGQQYETGCLLERQPVAKTKSEHGRSHTPYQAFFVAALKKHLPDGHITFVTPSGRISVGDTLANDATAAEITVRVGDLDFFRKVVCYGNLGMGEAYMDGDFTVDEGRLPELLTMLLKSGIADRLRGDPRFVVRYIGLKLVNASLGKAKNIKRHYDVGDDLFDCFLTDPYQVYSCGYAQDWNDDIATLQHNKLDRICRKLALHKGLHLLDIGSGNGGLLIHAALNYGTSGVGITNSRSHYERSMARIKALGLADRAMVHYGDFSTISGQFDRVVSVGMLEHVPPREYPGYFAKIAQALRPHGQGLVHAIGVNTKTNRHDPFIQKYIFPGSDTPKLSTISGELEGQNLAILDVENIARHYAVTTRRWLEDFRRNCGSLDPQRYEKSFKRMWEYYLCCGIAAALAGNLAVYQVLFTNDYFASYPFQRI